MADFIQQNAELVLALVVIWTLPWKGVALWKAARKSDRLWFIALLVLHSLAILEILYIFVFSKKRESGAKPENF